MAVRFVPGCHRVIASRAPLFLAGATVPFRQLPLAIPIPNGPRRIANAPKQLVAVPCVLVFKTFVVGIIAAQWERICHPRHLAHTDAPPMPRTIFGALHSTTSRTFERFKTFAFALIPIAYPLVGTFRQGMSFRCARRNVGPRPSHRAYPHIALGRFWDGRNVCG